MDKKNVIILVLAVLLAAVVSGGAVYYWTQSSDKDDSTSTADVTAPTDKSDLSITDVASELQPVDESIATQIQTIDDETLLTQAMADKYSKPVSDVDLTINENDGTYAQGLVKFAGEVAGGWWLAAKTSGDWVIVADGNGTVICADIAGYNFPTSMVPECWDEATSSLVTR